jgi:Cof subfamily protein (haloacid dehalogenase superfamily)
MLVLDLDDTLLNDDIYISEDNIKALAEAKKKGIIITMCSGRPSNSIVDITKKLEIINNDDYYISYNGSVINDYMGNNIFYKPISNNILHSLIDLGKEYGVDVQIYSSEGLIVEKYTSRTKKYEQLASININIVNDLKVYNESTKVLYNYNDIKLLQKMKDHITNLYKDEVNVFFSKPTFLEVCSKEANKGLAVQYLANYLHIKQEEIIAIGDSFNDKYMIEYVGLGVAISNAREEIKEIANYVTKSNNNENGVAEVINKFILKK